MNIIVTGCSRGVGLEICRVLLEQGNTVYGIARSCPDEFKALQSEYGGKLFFKSVDLSDCENVRQNVFKDYCGNKIRIDGYVNNAAVAYDDIVTNLNLERLKAMYNVNVFTPMMMTKNVIRNMILHHTNGVIIHISSISVHTGYKGLQCMLHPKEPWKLSPKIPPASGDRWESVPMWLFRVLWQQL